MKQPSRIERFQKFAHKAGSNDFANSAAWLLASLFWMSDSAWYYPGRFAILGLFISGVTFGVSFFTVTFKIRVRLLLPLMIKTHAEEFEAATTAVIAQMKKDGRIPDGIEIMPPQYLN